MNVCVYRLARRPPFHATVHACSALAAQHLNEVGGCCIVELCTKRIAAAAYYNLAASSFDGWPSSRAGVIDDLRKRKLS